MREGFEEDQATAIAFRMFRDGELRIDRRQARPQRQQQRLPTQAQKAQNAMRQANLANSIYQLFKLVMKK